MAMFKTMQEVELPDWSQHPEWDFIKAIITVKYSTADDYVCNVSNFIKVGCPTEWILLPAEEVAEKIGCSVHKLGELFMDSVRAEVYQHVIEDSVSE
jgi:hypothetical protein